MTHQIDQLPLDSIIAGSNDRTRFPQAELDALAASIAAHGLAQPITVRAVPGSDRFEIVAGERRFRACQQLGLATIPAFVGTLSDEAASAIMLAENTARANLDPVDEARAYASRMETYGWTVEQCAHEAGVSAVRVQFRLKLLRLREDLQALVRTGGLPLGYAQILADADLDPNRQGIALRRLGANPAPTPAWFRTVCSELFAQQAQEPLWLFTPDAGTLAPLVEIAPVADPPTPATTAPPTAGGIAGMIRFWQEAADAWELRGKNFKRQECEAAVQALRYALALA